MFYSVMSPKHAHILVVDDEPEMLFALQLLFKSKGREVVTEKNLELLRSLLRQHFAVMLLDLNYRCCPHWKFAGTIGNGSARKVTFLSVSACVKR
jgi:CheY-like chemotaxis protein